MIERSNAFDEDDDDDDDDDDNDSTKRTNNSRVVDDVTEMGTMTTTVLKRSRFSII